MTNLTGWQMLAELRELKQLADAGYEDAKRTLDNFVDIEGADGGIRQARVIDYPSHPYNRISIETD